MAQILLVEPDHILANTYAAALAREGHHVLCASEAQSAVNATDAVLPDCIILEVQLPAHNGIEFLYELRSHADWQTIPVVVLSQLPLDRLDLDPAKMEELGVVAYHYKPQTSLVTLSFAVEEALKAPTHE